MRMRAIRRKQAKEKWRKTKRRGKKISFIEFWRNLIEK